MSFTFTNIKNNCDVHLLVIVIKLLPTNAVRIQPYELQLI